eukprot:2469167-Karenia_brevis.AAC.1
MVIEIMNLISNANSDKNEYHELYDVDENDDDVLDYDCDRITKYNGDDAYDEEDKDDVIRSHHAMESNVNDMLWLTAYEVTVSLDQRVISVSSSSAMF